MYQNYVTHVFFFQIDLSFTIEIEYPPRFVRSSDIPLSVNNEWVLHKIVTVRVRIPNHVFNKIPHTTKIILEKLVNNTNCTFEMRSLKTVTELFGRRYVGIKVKNGISLSLRDYQTRHTLKWPKRKETNICAQVIKLKVEAHSIFPADTFDLFPNVIELEINHRQFFDFNLNLNHPKVSLSKFAKLKHLSIVFDYGFFLVSEDCKTSAIHIPKQIQTLKMDAIYSNTNHGLQLPILIEYDSVLRTLEFDCSYSDEKVEVEREINNFIENLNLCNKLNYFECLKINICVRYDYFSNQLNCKGATPKKNL